jgi:hypothetical protein
MNNAANSRAGLSIRAAATMPAAPRALSEESGCEAVASSCGLREPPDRVGRDRRSQGEQGSLQSRDRFASKHVLGEQSPDGDSSGQTRTPEGLGDNYAGERAAAQGGTSSIEGSRCYGRNRCSARGAVAACRVYAAPTWSRRPDARHSSTSSAARRAMGPWRASRRTASCARTQYLPRQ